MIKLYFAVWIVVFAIAIDILNNNIDNKLFRADVIIIVALFCGFIIKDLYKQLSEDPNHIYVYENSLKSVGIAFIALVLLLFTTLPEKLKKLNFIKIEPIKVTPLVYVVAVFCFINGWTIIKSGNILGENEKHLLPNLVGIYYDEHCEYRKARDVISNFNSNNILITKYARENLEDMTADNTLLITEDPYRQIWAMATLEYTGKNVNFRQILKYSNQNRY